MLELKDTGEDASCVGSEQKERRSGAWNRRGPYSRNIARNGILRGGEDSGERRKSLSSPQVLGLQAGTVGGEWKHQGRAGEEGGIREGKLLALVRCRVRV